MTKKSEAEKEQALGPQDSEVTLASDADGDLLLEDLKSNLESRDAELLAQMDRLVRVQADFDNFRKRVDREREEMAKTAAEQLITRLLEVIDNLERALAHMRSDERAQEHVRGLEMILDQLVGTLAVEGLAEIECLDKPFDPLYHEAMARDTSEDVSVDTVTAVLQTGYTLKGKVIRHARVKVSVPPSSKENASDNT